MYVQNSGQHPNKIEQKIPNEFSKNLLNYEIEHNEIPISKEAPEKWYNYTYSNWANIVTRTNGLESYPYDYPYDYSSSINIGNVVNTNFVPINFKAIVYGPVENPAFSIAGHVYRVNTSLESSEYLTVDTLRKTITKTDRRGNITNLFGSRDLSAGYIFEKIPVGENSFVVNPETNVDLTLYAERSEPEWI